jgi:hypothetical protein
MEIRIDSRPWAEDHSSPRSPRHVLHQSVCVLKIVAGGHLPKNGQADLAAGIYVWVEAGAATICGNGKDAGSLCRVFFAKLDGELEESELIGRVGWADDQGADMAHIDVATGNRQRKVRTALDLAQLAGDAQDRLVRHEV